MGQILCVKKVPFCKSGHILYLTRSNTDGAEHLLRDLKIKDANVSTKDGF